MSNQFYTEIGRGRDLTQDERREWALKRLRPAANRGDSIELDRLLKAFETDITGEDIGELVTRCDEVEARSRAAVQAELEARPVRRLAEKILNEEWPAAARAAAEAEARRRLAGPTP